MIYVTGYVDNNGYMAVTGAFVGNELKAKEYAINEAKYINRYSGKEEMFSPWVAEYGTTNVGLRYFSIYQFDKWIWRNESEYIGEYHVPTERENEKG